MLKVKGTEQLDDVTRLFKTCEAPIKKAMQQQSKQWAPTLRQAAVSRASDPISRAVAASGRVTVTAKGLRAVFGSSGAFHGEPLRNLAAPWEFGTKNRDQFGEYLSRHRLSRRAMRVKRRVQRQVPSIKPTGRFIYPAVADVTPDLVGRYVKAIADVMRDGR